MNLLFFLISGGGRVSVKNIMVGVSGGIAAFKSAVLVSQLTQKGFQVNVLMTHAATQFITPLTMQALSHQPVAVDLYEEKDSNVISHIDLADRADLFVIAPATANIIGKTAGGIADDLLSTTLLATKAPIVMVPAMNVHMYHNSAVQHNLHVLKSRDVHIIEPGEGQLACGHKGEGRMAEPEKILDWIENFAKSSNLLNGKKILITAGPTIEPLDPVRFFSNFSSGKMGYALAASAVSAGAEVTLVSGPVSLSTPEKVNRIDVSSAEEMRAVVMKLLPSIDIVIKAAAVADYRPKEVFDQKIKKKTDEFVVSLTRTTDIAAEIGNRKEAHQLFVGFAAETEQLRESAMAKRKNKRMDLIVANNIAKPGAGFNVDTNIVDVYDSSGQIASWPRMAKTEVAHRIIQLIGERIHAQSTYCRSSSRCTYQPD